MPRTATEIEAEIEAKKAAGVHQASREMRDLRDELKAAQASPTAPLDVGTVAVTRSEDEMADGTPDPYRTDEWRFIEKACAEVELRDDGNQSNIVKKVYQTVDAKLKVWRIAREIVAQVGIGNEWPQFAALNRNPNTGAKVEPKPPAPVRLVPPPAVPQPTSEVDLYAASVRAQMSALTSALPKETATA